MLQTNYSINSNIPHDINLHLRVYVCTNCNFMYKTYTSSQSKALNPVVLTFWSVIKTHFYL